MTVHTPQANKLSTLPDSANVPMWGKTTFENRFAFSALPEPMQAIYKANPDLMQRQDARRSRWLAVVAYVKDHGIAGTVLCTGQGRGAVITPDVQEGCYRYSCFDDRGFFAHGTYDTAENALAAAFDMGYSEIADPEILEKMALNWH